MKIKKNIPNANYYNNKFIVMATDGYHGNSCYHYSPHNHNWFLSFYLWVT